jgi:hypothetical protein
MSNSCTIEQNISHTIDLLWHVRSVFKRNHLFRFRFDWSIVNEYVEVLVIIWRACQLEVEHDLCTKILLTNMFSVTWNSMFAHLLFLFIYMATISILIKTINMISTSLNENNVDINLILSQEQWTSHSHVYWCRCSKKNKKDELKRNCDTCLW